MSDRDGILTIGYCYPQMYMAERYNALRRPYWGMKSFLSLALLCRMTTLVCAEAAPMPVLERLAHAIRQYAGCSCLAGRVTAHAAGVNEGHGHGHSRKSMQNLPTIPALASAPPAPGGAQSGRADSMLAFVIDDNVFVRKVSKNVEN